MLRRTRHRLEISLFAVLTLLFSQLALASYVCPGQSGVEAMSATIAAGEPCEGMDQVQPTLCHQHSAGAAQSFEAVHLPTASLPAVIQVLAVPSVVDTGSGLGLPIAGTVETRPPPDPLFLSTLRLRV